ncbi:fungal-specific transcription factor domain-containing protein [Mycena alexandri]|uniref:Fungal-specific transcription factor domain-containing protein n=1 Tax=Mycena alexandri TaxID=1745969 RepID=A0AAD6TC75_9AGAR|nr:fungal-specific transcription factor domain-containing protein [Mycena alexandri]
MSNDEEFRAATSTAPIKIKGLRACDACRRRKIRCDGLNTAESCTNCRCFNSPCTYVRPSVKRGHVSIDDANKDNASLRSENMSLKSENTSLKSENTSLEIESASLRNENLSLKAKLRSLSICSLCQTQVNGPYESDSLFHRQSYISTSTNKQSDDDDDITGNELASRFQQFSLESMQNKIFKPAGTFGLASQAMAWEKDAYDGRPQYYIYPDDDLMTSLLQLYFTNVHPTIPVLHRPSFERSVAEGLHRQDSEFGGLLISALAVASRYSDDPRVFVTGDNTSLSAGWKFANQIQIRLRKPFEPTLYEIQTYCLMSVFTLGTSRPEISAVYTGLGISFLQLRGEYRQKREGRHASYQTELWRRVFWCYAFLDGKYCIFNGSPPAITLENYDVDLTLEIDDDYWDRGFVQPLGKPSVGSYLVHQAKLCKILGDVMRRLFASKETKICLGWAGSEWEHNTVAELDSAMNDFLDSIPAHLRWDPDSPPQGIFFDQSVVLHVTYYQIQIMIHRPYIHKMHALAAPSLSICTSAARTVLRIARGWLDERQGQPFPTVANAVFISGIILVLNSFGTKRSGRSMATDKDSNLIETAMELLKLMESRFQPIGRLWELLRELRSLDPLPVNYPASGEPASVPSHGQRLDSGKLNQGSFFEPFPELSDRGRSPRLKPGMSIEQLLADTDHLTAMNGAFDDELMSMWMAVPTDIA